jgi:quinol monooxygenase YgiN
MYGTVARFRVKPKQGAALRATLERWRRAGKPKAQGLIGDYVLKSERIPGEWIAMVFFDNEENYRRNAADPEQHRQFEEIRAHLRADPEWNDGEIFAVEPAAAPR